jgi:hypothetical protein
MGAFLNTVEIFKISLSAMARGAGAEPPGPRDRTI